MLLVVDTCHHLEAAPYTAVCEARRSQPALKWFSNMCYSSSSVWLDQTSLDPVQWLTFHRTSSRYWPLHTRFTAKDLHALTLSYIGPPPTSPLYLLGLINSNIETQLFTYCLTYAPPDKCDCNEMRCFSCCGWSVWTQFPVPNTLPSLFLLF